MTLNLLKRAEKGSALTSAEHDANFTAIENEVNAKPDGTNLTYTASPTGGVVASDTGTDATLPLADGTNAGLMAPAQHSKLAGIASGATANATDAQLRDRSTHTGTQAISTVDGLQTALDGKLSAADASVTNAREWSAATIDQAEAEAGTATTRRAFTAQRVAQAIAAQVAAWWNALTVGPGKITMATARLLGRTSAGSGAAEEISIGSGLSLSGGTLSATSSGGTPGGSSAQVQWNNGGAFAGASGLTTNGTELTIASGTKTANAPALDVTQTWNNAAVAFTGLRLNVTDTASASGSLLANFQSAGATVFSVSTRQGLVIDTSVGGGNIFDFRRGGASRFAMDEWGNTTCSNGVTFTIGVGTRIENSVVSGANGFRIRWSSTGSVLDSVDTALARNAAGVLEVNNGTAGTLRDLRLRNLIATQVVQTQALTVATLPAAASWSGAQAYVTDANAPTVGSTVASGGSARAVVRSNNTDWIVTAVI